MGAYEELIGPKIEALYVQRYAEWIAGNGTYEDTALANALVNLCESEIERRMLVELLFADWGYATHQAVEIFDCSYPEGISGDSIITLAPQYPVGKYRIDIAVVVQLGGGKRLLIAVECDGHDFHERTKEQAQRDKKRDRDIQRAGYFVFRFTGSEIYREGKRCAAEVADLASRAIWDATMRKEPVVA